MKQSRISTQEEVDKFAREVARKSRGAGRASADKIARESKARIEQFCRGRV